MMHKWKVSLFLMVGALGLIFLTTGAAYAACPDGITNYWKLDETSGTTYEDFINGNDGEDAATGPDPANGTVNGAQEFDGTMGINVPPAHSFGWYSDESFSIEYWVKIDSLPGSTEVVVGRDDSSTNLHWWSGIESDGRVSFVLRDINGNGAAADLLNASDPLALDEWHHVVAVRDGDNDLNILYVDGVETDRSGVFNYTAGFGSTSANLNIGWLNFMGFFTFDGVIDEVALYERALSPTEIQQHHTNGLLGQDYCLGSGAPSSAPYPEDTVAYWKLDETTGTTYEDSISGNDGEGTGDPTPVAGTVNGAQEFDGTNDINVPADRSFGWYQNESFSIEYWMKKTGIPPANNEVIIGRRDAAGQPSWWVGLDTVTGFAHFRLADKDTKSDEKVGTTNLGDGQWHHVVAVMDGVAAELRLYVDGQEDLPAVATAFTAGFDSETARINMGWLENTGTIHGFRYTGALDEVAIYDRALLPTEIETHYDNGLLGRGIGYVSTPTPTPTPKKKSGGGGGCFIATATE